MCSRPLFELLVMKRPLNYLFISQVLALKLHIYCTYFSMILIICGEPAISLHSHHVSLVQWTNPLLPVTRDLGSNPLGGTYVKPGFSY
jgi:hypothetical protein